METCDIEETCDTDIGNRARYEAPGDEVARDEAPGGTGIERVKTIRQRVIALSWPALIEMILVTLVGMVDMIMVGRLGPAAITAVGLTNQPMFLALAVFMALNVGTTAIVARAIGSGRPDEANATTRQSMILTCIMGIAFSVLGYMLAGDIIRLMGAAEDVMPLGTSYMQFIAMGGLFVTLSMSLSSALRGAGDTRTPMRINVIANLLNVIGNYALIYGKLGFPVLGVAGAAISTTFSRFVACAMILRVIYGGGSVIALSLRDRYSIDPDLVKRILRIGFPAAVEQFILRGGQLAYVRIVAGFGTVTFAAHQIAMNILGLSFMPGQAFSVAATTLVGQGLGAGSHAFAQRAALETRKLGMIVSGTMAAGFFFFGRQIAALYTSDPTVIAKTAMVLKIIGLVQPAQSTQFILAGGLRGAGDTKWPLYSTFIGIWGVRVVLGYILAVVFRLELLGAWIAMAVDQCVRSAIIYMRFRTGAWKNERV
ncbi:MAG: MATE family efflux transporter [Firmicutes bacterium]|nr:MATE family efflux transporter [Bacillota bacterium]